MRGDLYIIEARKPDGSLDFTGPQPESVFGNGAITGMDDWAMSRVIFAKFPNARSGSDTPIQMHGTNICEWPKNIDPRWVARRKTW